METVNEDSLGQENTVPPDIDLENPASQNADSSHERKNELPNVGVSPAAGASSAEERCPICLGDFEDKAFLEACFHTFCLACIARWAESTTNKCPMCKTSFEKIIHNVRANDDYDVFKVAAKPSTSSANDGDAFEAVLRNFRGYRTTRLPRQPSEPDSTDSTDSTEPSGRHGFWGWLRQIRVGGPARRRVRGQRKEIMKPALVQRRRAVYSAGLRALPLTGVRGGSRPIRVRDVSASFFHSNPASTHRLYSWLNRELTVLVGEEHVQFVIQIIMSMIDKVDMESDQFASQLEPFLHEKTSHFMHEFLAFATCPYDMIAYDKNVSYNWAPDVPGHAHNNPDEQVEVGDNEDTDTPVPFQQRIYDELTATSWGDSPPIVETLSPSYVNHSSDSEFESQDVDIETMPVHQRVNAEIVIVGPRVDVESMPDEQRVNEQRVNVETVPDEQRVNQESMTLEPVRRVNPERETLEPIQRVKVENDTSNQSKACIKNPGNSAVETSASIPQPGPSQGQRSATTDYIRIEDSTDYEINLYAENEDTPSNQGDNECLRNCIDQDEEHIDNTWRHLKTKTREDSDLTRHDSDRLDKNSKSGSKEPRHHNTKYHSSENKDNRENRKRQRRSKSASSAVSLERYSSHKSKKSSRRDKRQTSDSYTSSNDSSQRREYSRHSRDRHRRDTKMDRWRSRDSKNRSISRSRSKYSKGKSSSKSYQRQRHSNYSSSEDRQRRTSKNRRESSRAWSPGIKSRDVYSRRRYPRSRSRSYSPDRGNSPFYQRKKGHRSKLYSDDHCVGTTRDQVATEPYENFHASKKGRKKSGKAKRDFVAKEDDPIEEGPDTSSSKTKCELTIELSGLEEEIKDNKRDLLKSMLRRERIELLRKNLSAEDQHYTYTDDNQACMLDAVKPVNVCNGSTSVSEMQTELESLDVAILDGKKHLLRVMKKMEEDEVKQETDEENI